MPAGSGAVSSVRYAPLLRIFLLQHFSHQGFIKPAGQGGKEWLRIRHGNS